MRDRLFQVEEFGAATQNTAAIIFICPYGTPIEKVRFAIRRFLTSEGVTEFSFFGSSLGSFILYNCVGRQVVSAA
jgi:hypothetical protein